MGEEQTNKNGGARAGAGRPRKPVVETAGTVKREFYTPKLLRELLNREYEIAMGRLLVETPVGKDGGIVKLPPNHVEQLRALQDLLDRGMGRAVQAIDMQAEVSGGGLPIIINFARYIDNDASDSETN